MIDKNSTKEEVLAAVKEWGLSLQYASEALKADKEVALVAVRKNWSALQYVGESLKTDRELVIEAARQDWRTTTRPEIFVRDELKIKKRDFLVSLLLPSEELKKDKEIVLLLILQYGSALEFVSKELQADKEVVLAAVKQDWRALDFASDELRGDEDVLREFFSRKDFFDNQLEKSFPFFRD